MQYQGAAGHVKIPLEVMEEIKEGRKDGDLLIDWISDDANYDALLFQEAVDAALVQHVVANGYAPDLTDDEVDKIGRDPFLIAYAMVPVVILGGSQKDSVRELYQQVYDAVVVAGCAGVAIGNNIWRNPDPAAITRGLAAIIHGGASVDEALTVAGQTAELVASVADPGR